MNSKNEKVDYIYKIILIGDSAVGKTNILASLVHGEYVPSAKPTIGVEFGNKTFNIDNSIVKAQIWDTAGQERYHAITSAYYRGAYGAVIVYDITKYESLENVERIWLKNLNKIVNNEIPIMFLGNKIDLESDRVIEKNAGKNMALKYKGAFFETSAKSGENIVKAFEIFIRSIYNADKVKNKYIKVKGKKLQKGLNLMEKKKKIWCW